MRCSCKALSFPTCSDLLHLFTVETPQRGSVRGSFTLKGPPGSPAAWHAAAGLMLVRKAHDHFWRTERNTATARNTFPSSPPSRRDKIIPAGKTGAAGPRPGASRCASWPIVVSGRAAAVRAELLAFHRETSRMALFTSKRFAKTRACHDNFPHLKGNIRSYSATSRNTVSKCHIFLPPTFISLHEKGPGRDFGASRCS